MLPKKMCKGCFFEHNGWDECFEKQDNLSLQECEDFVLPENVDIWGEERQVQSDEMVGKAFLSKRID